MGIVQHRRTHDMADTDDHEGDIFDALTGTSTPLDAGNPPIPDDEKGAANGVAELDGSGFVPMAQLPPGVTSGVIYKGTWNATTNIPALSNGGGGGVQGDYYRVGTAGSTSIDGITDWKVDDWIINNGTVWEKVDNTQDVHAIGGALHDPSTKAQFNVKVSDADFEDKTVLETTMDSKVTTHTGNAAAHHSKTSSVGELSDHNKATHDALGIDADTVDGDHKADLEATMDSKDTAAIGAHAGVSSAHHAKYTDPEAVTAMGVKGDANPLNHDRYDNAEAVVAMGAKTDGNPLNHDRPTQATHTNLGLVEIGTQAEVDAGINDAVAVTPLKLATKPFSMPSGSSFPGTPADGQMFYHTTKTRLFIYDNSRTKWLTVERASFTLGRQNCAANATTYLGLADLFTSSVTGVKMPRDGTIVSVTMIDTRSAGGSGARGLNLRVNDASVKAFTLPDSGGVNEQIDAAVNVNFSAGDKIQARLEAVVAGRVDTDVIVEFEVAWR